MPQIPALKAEAHLAQTAAEFILCPALGRVHLPDLGPILEFDFDILCAHVGATWVISVGLALLNRISQRRYNASRRKAGEGRGGLSGQTGRQSPRPTPVPEAPAPR